MAMMGSTAALAVGGSSLSCGHRAKFRIQSSSCCSRLPCNATVVHDDDHRRCWQQQRARGNNFVGESQKGAATAERSGPLRLSAVVVPILAAALVGSVQPAVQASEWDNFLVPVDDTETISGDGEYKGLLQRIKERRARVKAAPPEPTEEKTDAGASTNSLPFFSPAPVYSPPPAPQSQKAPAARPEEPAAEVPKQSPVEIFQKENQVAQVELQAVEKQKTHGFLPLFLSQFLLLVATVGGGYVLVATPESKWAEVQKTVDGYVEKAIPMVENSWTNAKPVAIQAQQKAQVFAETAQPYVVKAWEASKPLAGKAVEASKPILKGLQTKAAELFQQAKSNRR